MPVTAVNCTPLRPKAAFGRNEDYIDAEYSDVQTRHVPDIGDAKRDYISVTALTDRASEKFVKSGDIKSPLAVMGSLGTAAAVSYLGGKKISSFIDASCFSNKLGSRFEEGLKYISNKLNPNRGTNTFIEKMENGARNFYKKFAYSKLAPVSDKYSAVQRASDAFSKTAGAAAAVFTLGKISTQDSNKDGVTDILQKSRNAYTKAKTNYGDAIETAGIISEIIQSLT